MRTRKANKSRHFSYSQAYDDELGSESEEDLQDIQDVEDQDVDFKEPEADGDEGPDGSAADDDDDDDDEVMNDAGAEDEDLLEDAKLEELRQDAHAVDSADAEDDDGTAVKQRWKPTGRSKWVLKLLERGTVHAVPEYPSDLRKTRMWDGPLKPWTRSQQLINILYGPETGHIKIARGMLRKWFDSQVLPNVLSNEGGVMHSPWLAEDYEEKEKRWSKSWYEKYRAANPELQKSRKIRSEHIDMFKPPSDDLICFVGPFNKLRQTRTQYGSGVPVTQSGEPLENSDNESSTPLSPKGWLLDTGGIPLSIGWAPSRGHREQFLAVCTVPYADQELKDHDAGAADAEEMKRGSVQIWSIPLNREDASPARVATSLQFEFGRAKRMQWCPVAAPDDHIIGILAVLCGDGQVRVLEALRANTVQETYEWILSPVSTLGFSDEYMVHTTCITWVNTNRICLGHSDGSISLWSVYPQCMLMRRSVHNSHILDIASGFPSHPYHIATSPVSGSPALTDLNLPSAETTSIPLPNSLNFQPNLLDWNDHLQGYFHIHPSPTPHHNVIGWAHARYFVESRILMTTPSSPMCIASGRTHPFTLVGCADGSLWAMNPLRVLVRERLDELYKIKVMEHEFRPARKLKVQHTTTLEAEQQKVLRGAVRILQGFKPEINRNPHAELTRELNAPRNPSRRKKKKPGKTGKTGKAGKSTSKNPNRRAANAAALAAVLAENPVEEMDESSDDDGRNKAETAALAKALDRSKAVVHEARTRITAAAWNPNIEYGWWAAAAMGSGLVKIMDLGIGD